MLLISVGNAVYPYKSFSVMSVKTHYIIAFILSAIPMIAGSLYMQLNQYGEVLFWMCIGSMAPVWVLWFIVRSHDKRISSKLNQVIKQS